MADRSNLDEIKAEIELAKADLYVFKDSTEKEKWSKLLEKAEQAIAENPPREKYAKKIVNRVNEVIGGLWKRIFRWQALQKNLSIAFTLIFIVEIIVILFYYSKFDLYKQGFYTSTLFGLLGGTSGVLLTLGEDLRIGSSNRLYALKTALRPLVGLVSALLVFNLLELNIIKIVPTINQEAVLVVLSFFAGFSERFVMGNLDIYMSKIIKT